MAEEFGMCGQSVWERLKKLGFQDQDRWTEEQLIILKNTYFLAGDGAVDLNKLEAELGKFRSNISRKARKLGLTSRHRKKSEQVCREIGQRTKDWLKNNPHPRGAYKVGKEIRICPVCGMFFEVFPASEQKYCSRECGQNHRQAQGNQGYAKTGKRIDLDNQYFRSSWEANYARYLNFIIKNDKSMLRWEYEPQTFEFKKIKKGTRFYTPDFKIYFASGAIEYHEVKGWDYPKGRTARKRFLKYFPNLKLVLIDGEWFKALKRQGVNKLIPNWE